MKIKQSIALVLVMLMIGIPLAGCSKEPAPSADTTASPSADETTAVPESTEPPETEYPAPQVENTDYKGQTFRILANEPRTEFPYSEIYTANNRATSSTTLSSAATTRLSTSTALPSRLPMLRPAPA